MNPYMILIYCPNMLIYYLRKYHIFITSLFMDSVRMNFSRKRWPFIDGDQIVEYVRELYFRAGIYILYSICSGLSTQAEQKDQYQLKTTLFVAILILGILENQILAKIIFSWLVINLVDKAYYLRITYSYKAYWLGQSSFFIELMCFFLTPNVWHFL